MMAEGAHESDSEDDGPEEWSCPTCYYPANPIDLDVCQHCGEPKPANESDDDLVQPGESIEDVQEDCRAFQAALDAERQARDHGGT